MAAQHTTKTCSERLDEEVVVLLLPSQNLLLEWPIVFLAVNLRHYQLAPVRIDPHQLCSNLLACPHLRLIRRFFLLSTLLAVASVEFDVPIDHIIVTSSSLARDNTFPLKGLGNANQLMRLTTSDKLSVITVKSTTQS